MENISINVARMLIQIHQSEQKIIIVGLGISGIESANFCQRSGLRYLAVEKENQESFLKKSRYSEQVNKLISDGAEIYFGIDGERINQKLENVKLAILSPGVPVESAICAVLKRNNIPFISELELGIEIQNIPSIVVTGSNGKSTTVSLIHDIFKRAGYDSRLCGNVGTPVIASVESAFSSPEKSDKRILIVEASSYQLETCTLLKPTVAMLLNISENHLERHGDMNRYLKTKARVFANQDKTDFAVLSADDQRISDLRNEIKSEVLAFTAKADSLKGFFGFSQITYQPETKTDIIKYNDEIYHAEKSKLRGLHNRFNIAAAIVACRSQGILPQIIQESIEAFDPLEHRFENCNEVNAINCIDDSKATTVAASMAALETALNDYPENKITLMIGGLSKAGSWDPLCKLIIKNLQKLNQVICFGKDAGLLANYLKNFKIPYLSAANLEQAVDTAFKNTSQRDVILFSPGCASFDQFGDFEERGREFKRLLKMGNSV